MKLLVVSSFCKIVFLHSEIMYIFFWFLFWHAWLCDLRYNFIIKGRLWNNYDLPSPNLNEPNLTSTSSPAAQAAKSCTLCLCNGSSSSPQNIRCLWCCLPVTISQWSGIMILDWWFNFVGSVTWGILLTVPEAWRWWDPCLLSIFMVQWNPLESGDRGELCLVGAWGSVASATICFDPPWR